MRFESGQFFTSALDSTEFPKRKIPEIAVVGRSNVGKSSLINALFSTKKLAKTSKTPGKTQRINFFSLDDHAFLVDLPGYGYATAPKEEIKKWSQAIDEYLNEREQLKLVLLLIDIRRSPSKEDLSFVEWIKAKHIPLLIVFTKKDKVSRLEGEKRMQESLSFFPEGVGFLSFCNRNIKMRDHLIQKINEALS